MWISSTCRLDTAQAVYRAARHMAKPTRAVMGAAQRVLLYLLRTASMGLTFGGAGTDAVLQAMHKSVSSQRMDGSGGAGRSEVQLRQGLQAMSDASWEALEAGVTGHVGMFNGGALSWTSKKQPSVSLSSAEAETFAAASAAADVLWIRGLLSELGVPQDSATNLWIDNEGAVAVAGDARSLGRSKHIARRSQFLIEAQGRRQIRCRHISGEVQAADLLTKPLERKRFMSLRRYLMNTDAMVEAPMQENGNRRACPSTPAGEVCKGGDNTADASTTSGMNDRNRNGTDHGGVLMPDCLPGATGSSYRRYQKLREFP